MQRGYNFWCEWVSTANSFWSTKWKSKLLALAKRFPKKNFGVFFCGPPVGQEMIIAACKEASKPKRDGGSKFVFYHENF
jgi:hypothetical protein